MVDEATRMMLGQLPAEERDSILRDMAILARVKAAPMQGTVILEMSKELFESMAHAQAPGGTTHRVEWTIDDLGFAAPTVYRDTVVDTV